MLSKRLAVSLLAALLPAFAGQVASYERLAAPPGVWAYRSGPFLVTANLTEYRVPLPEPAGEVLLATGREAETGTALGPWQGRITRVSQP